MRSYEDAAELHEIFSDPQPHTLGEGPSTSVAQTAAWISRRAETKRRHGLVWYAVRDRADGQMLGNCGLFAGRTGSAEPEIGYEIRGSCQGQGLATEAASAVQTTPSPAGSAASGRPSGRTTPRPCASRPRSE